MRNYLPQRRPGTLLRTLPTAGRGIRPTLLSSSSLRPDYPDFPPFNNWEGEEGRRMSVIPSDDLTLSGVPSRSVRVGLFDPSPSSLLSSASSSYNYGHNVNYGFPLPRSTSSLLRTSSMNTPGTFLPTSNSIDPLELLANSAYFVDSLPSPSMTRPASRTHSYTTPPPQEEVAHECAILCNCALGLAL